MKKDTGKYQPIDCGFYDRIELAIMRSRKVELLLEGSEIPLRVQMIDTVQTEDGEFVRLQDSSLLRMDRIVSMDGIAATGESGPACSLNRRF